ncbi:MAG: hypothetical protein QXR19_14465 [Candidatus Jordarchaeaceae archaeon]
MERVKGMAVFFLSSLPWEGSVYRNNFPILTPEMKFLVLIALENSGD